MARASLRRGVAVAAAAPALLALAACGGQGSAVTQPAAAAPAAVHLSCPLPTGGVGVAVANRANSPRPEVTPVVETVLGHAVQDQSSVAFFSTDGQPTKVGRLALKSDTANPQARASEVATMKQQLGTGVQRIRAKVAQSDPLGALDDAARSVHAQGAHGTVVLIDSGLQTTGTLRYQSQRLLLASGHDIVGYLHSSRELPDLRGLTVVLSGIGDTAAPQEKLDIASRSRLVEQWTAITKAGGAACVVVDSSPLLAPSMSGLPRVATVAVPKAARPQLDLAQPVALREDSVGFQDDSAELRDPALARQDLQTIAGQIRRGHHRVLLVGTTATAGTEQGRRTLSLRRAQAVKGLLVGLGVPASHVTTRGAGTHYPAHVKDVDAHGNLIPAAAVRNRAVFLITKS